MSATQPASSQRQPSTPKRMSPKAIAAIIITVLALIFVFSNLDDGSMHFLGFVFVLPRWLWFLIVLVAGVVIGSLFPWFLPKRKKKS